MQFILDKAQKNPQLNLLEPWHGNCFHFNHGMKLRKGRRDIYFRNLKSNEDVTKFLLFLF